MPITLAQTHLEADRVDINSPAELKFWAAEFQVTEPQLRAVIGRTGMMIDDIREELALQRARHGHIEWAAR
jgi:hypothetical protein